MSVSFYRGQQIGREDLNLFLENTSRVPVNAAEISYALYDFTTKQEVLLGVPRRIPANPSIGEYYASIIVPLDANLGDYRVRWTFRETLNAPIQQVVQEFTVVDKVTSSGVVLTGFTNVQASLIRSLRILLRDNNPDRNYHFRPPTHEDTVRQFNRVFGYIWEDDELSEYIDRGLDMVIAYPPRTPFPSVDAMVQMRPEWKTLVLTAAQIHALQALQINWVADEFDYSIGGISLNLDKAGKYESAKQSASEQFDKQIEKAKATINIIRAVQQPKFGTGIRSSFGPYSGAGILTPRKFVGF
jgi:hypothetical protein